MKKIFFVLTLILAFSINASAQEKRTVIQELSKKDSAEVTSLLGLNETQSADLYRLFEMKNEAVSNESLSDERRAELNRIIDLKLKASLTPEQIATLESKTELYARLIGKKLSK